MYIILFRYALDIVRLYQRSTDRGVTPHRPAAGRGGVKIFSGGAVAVHREIWRFSRLLAILSIFEE